LKTAEFNRRNAESVRGHDMTTNKDHHARIQHAMAFVNRDQLPKGAPVPGTGRQSWRSGLTNRRAGVSSGILSRERLLPHRYMDEGDKGVAHRRSLRRVSERFWRNELANES
jgi:hypothetical protein